ncbi:MAG: hypothetical protein U5L08_04455 [Xanthomonadales bacterium]|nr:hypothetical protein [Xanthomonadales bacterium]
MIEATLTILAAAAVGAFLHRLRGGGFKPAIPRFGLGRSLWLAAPLVGVAAWPFVGVLPAVYLALLYLLGSVSGWGSYFDLSRKRDGWVDDPEVPWIDKALMETFGPQWAADRERIHPEHAAKGDVIYMGGKERPASWRFWRDFVGMALRGVHYLPMLLVLPTVYASWWGLLPGVVAIALFTPAYWVGHQTRHGTGAAEYIVGGLFGAAVAGQYLLGV